MINLFSSDIHHWPYLSPSCCQAALSLLSLSDVIARLTDTSPLQILIPSPAGGSVIDF